MVKQRKKNYGIHPFYFQQLKITRKELEKKMEEDADQEYQQVAHDLPPEGQFHYLSSIDHIADRLCERFSRIDRYAPFRKIATRVVKRYCSSDTVESNRNEKRKERQWQRAQEARTKRPSPSRIPSWDSKKPKRLGTGSY